MAWNDIFKLFIFMREPDPLFRKIGSPPFTLTKNPYLTIIVVEDTGDGLLSVPQEEYDKADFVVTRKGSVLKSRDGKDCPLIPKEKEKPPAGRKYRSIDDNPMPSN